MSAYDFFLNLLSLVGSYINAFINIVMSTPALLIPFCIGVCCGFIGLVYKFLKG